MSCASLSAQALWKRELQLLGRFISSLSREPRPCVCSHLARHHRPWGLEQAEHRPGCHSPCVYVCDLHVCTVHMYVYIVCVGGCPCVHASVCDQGGTF